MLKHDHQVITLDPLSPQGYEMKHEAFHKAGDFRSAIDALETMLSKIVESPDPDILGKLYHHYHDKDDLFTLFDRARLPIHRPIERTNKNSHSCSTDYT